MTCSRTRAPVANADVGPDARFPERILKRAHLRDPGASGPRGAAACRRSTFAPAAIDRANRNAEAAGVEVRFEVDDLTDLAHRYGTFDLLVDYGTLDDLNTKQRARYLEQILPLAAPGARFLLWCFEWRLSRLERATEAILPMGTAFQPGDVDHMFAGRFRVEKIAGETRRKGWPKGYAAYLMTRKD